MNCELRVWDGEVARWGRQQNHSLRQPQAAASSLGEGASVAFSASRCDRIRTVTPARRPPSSAIPERESRGSKTLWRVSPERAAPSLEAPYLRVLKR